MLISAHSIHHYKNVPNYLFICLLLEISFSGPWNLCVPSKFSGNHTLSIFKDITGSKLNRNRKKHIRPGGVRRAPDYTSSCWQHVLLLPWIRLSKLRTFRIITILFAPRQKQWVIKTSWTMDIVRKI